MAFNWEEALEIVHQDEEITVFEEDTALLEETDNDIPPRQREINLLGVEYGDNEMVEGEEELLDGGEPLEEYDIGEGAALEGMNLPADEETQGAGPLPTNLSTMTQDGDKDECSEYVADGPRDKNTNVDDFHLALMIFVTAADLSTSMYEALTEVLALASTESIKRLPKSLRTLKERCRQTFPISPIKARPVEISLTVAPPKSSTPRLAYYFDVSHYCKIWLSNPRITSRLHMGLGRIVESPTELWHGDAWMESVRSTSGEFARIQEGTGTTDGVVLLPSDCVEFVDAQGILATGRVKAVGLDCRDKRYEKGVVSAIINRLVPIENLPDHIKASIPIRDDRVGAAKAIDKIMHKSFHSSLPELVLFESREVVPCSAICSRIWVYFTDYESPESLKSSLLPYPPTYCVRHIVYQGPVIGLQQPRARVRCVAKRHKVIAETELIQMSRAVVLAKLVSTGGALDTQRIASVPFSVFLDGFGLYRNAYKSLKGMYVTPAGLDVDSRSHLSNMFVLMIGPFGATELSMASCLAEDSRKMGVGEQLTLFTGEKVTVIAFPLLFTGDMPQQNMNSGNKAHNAVYGCRSCFVPDTKRGDLFLDVQSTGRYWGPTQRLLQHTRSLKSKSAQSAAQQRYGLTAEGPYFAQCYTMLDPQRSNPNDPLHAELRLCRYYAEVLIDGILSPTGVAAYQKEWSNVNVPFKWGQPQNPVTHKGSMVFSEHGRMAIMNPFVLMRMFLGPEDDSDTGASHHGGRRKIFLKSGVETRMKASFNDGEGLCPEREVRLQLLRTSFILAKMVHLALKRSLNQKEMRDFTIAVKEVCIPSPTG